MNGECRKFLCAVDCPAAAKVDDTVGAGRARDTSDNRGCLFAWVAAWPALTPQGVADGAAAPWAGDLA